LSITNNEITQNSKSEPKKFSILCTFNILGYMLGNNNQTDQGNETEALEREGLKRERSFAGFFISKFAGRISEAAMGGAVGAQRLVLHVEEPKKKGARARTRGKNQLVV
jgi:hypothetical protein